MLPLVTALLPLLGSVFDKVLPDDTARNKARDKLAATLLDNSSKIEAAAASVVLAEANGESWLQRNWRPMLMCLFGYIIAHNHVIAPLFGVPYADMPPQLWDLLKIGIGGYVISRGAEKGIKQWKNK